MEINFTNPEIIFIYGHFKKKIQELETLKITPGNPFSKTDINKDIKLYSSITNKLKEACPNLSKLDKYDF